MSLHGREDISSSPSGNYGALPLRLHYTPDKQNPRLRVMGGDRGLASEGEC